MPIVNVEIKHIVTSPQKYTFHWHGWERASHKPTGGVFKHIGYRLEAVNLWVAEILKLDLISCVIDYVDEEDV